ncbi:prenyltransferase/squalene oxidase repeat-containing protein [Streptomyces sp. NPDC015131]|uniref:prenyltransferase/squalene oxidase repeat-containing protein n=1 Tax=Streptomyces sp. NPDC015131 TaxID=3364941 RepID=UPI0036FA341C
MTTVRVRHGAAALAAAAVMLSGGVPAAHAAPSPAPSPSPAVPAGLYGTKDPTYDGVWRQSLAFMAQQVSGVEPSRSAVSWLMGQQCDSGGFASYRPDPARTCDPKTVLDTNATAVAVQALSGVDRPEADKPGTDPVSKAMDAGAAWLKGVQNPDGGWGYNPGSPSDANSTSLVISSLAALGHRPGDIESKAGKTPYDALLRFAIPCDAKQGAGAFAYQPDPKTGALVANGDATAAAVLAGLGKDLQTRGVRTEQPPTCERQAEPTAERAARNGAAYLTGALARTGHLDLPPMPGAATTAPQPDFGNTADAVIALGAAGQTQAARTSLGWLEKNAVPWAKESGPAAWAQLILAAHTAGADARDFGGVDLVKQLDATGPAPASGPPAPRERSGPAKETAPGSDGSAAAKESAADNAAESAAKSAEDEDAGFGIWLAVAVVLVAGMGIGFLVSGRRRKAQQR